MTAVDLIVVGFHFSGLAVLGLLAWALRNTLRQRPDGPRGGGGGGSDRLVPPRPPWSWQPRGGRSAGRRTGEPRPVRARPRR